MHYAIPTLRNTGALALVAMILSGCAGGSPSAPRNNLAIGTFEADITGSVTATATGAAVFGTPGPQQLISMASAPPVHNFRIIGDAGRPATGTYAITADAPFFVAGTVDGNQSVTLSTGSLTVTVSDPGELAGTFTFARRDAQGNVLFTVAGSFRARCGHIPENCN